MGVTASDITLGVVLFYMLTGLCFNGILLCYKEVHMAKKKQYVFYLTRQLRNELNVESREKGLSASAMLELILRSRYEGQKGKVEGTNGQ